MLRQALTLAFCNSTVSEFKANNKLHLVIGDGLGSLTSLISLCTDNKIVSINLNEILLVDYAEDCLHVGYVCRPATPMPVDRALPDLGTTAELWREVRTVQATRRCTT